MEYILGFSLLVSLCANAWLGFLFYKKKHVLTQDAKALLAELMSGQAILKIQVLDPSGLFYRSPKG